MWTIVFLAMGGIALGKGVMSSGLLEVMDELIRDLVDGFSLYSVVLVLSPVVLVSISAPSGLSSSTRRSSMDASMMLIFIFPFCHVFVVSR